jgi:hypothetical protein
LIVGVFRAFLVLRRKRVNDGALFSVIGYGKEGVVAKSNKAYTFRIVDLDVHAVQHDVPLESNWSFKFYSQFCDKSKSVVFNYRKDIFSAIMTASSPAGRIFID